MGPVARESAPRQGQRKGDFLAGKYLLEDCLGIGGMGEVYRATNVSLGRKVAIKILSAEYVKNEDDVLRFLREARAAAAVRHPNVVDVLDVARDDDGTPFIVQELLSGEDLEHYLNSRGGRLSAPEALEIMIAVAEAVAAAHERDVVHRDLKPANIFLSKEGTKITPKVLDFGACLFPTLGALSSKELRMLIGTPHYMAPEQIVSKTEVDQRADVWALGIIMYELLVGETPFEAETANAVLQLVKTREVPKLRTIVKTATEDVEELIASCTHRDKMKRLENAAAVVKKMTSVRDRMRGSRPRVDTLPEMDEVVAPAPAPAPSAGKPIARVEVKQTAVPKVVEKRLPEPRVPSLLIPENPSKLEEPTKKTPDEKTHARRRALLTLNQPGEDSVPPSSSRRDPPASEQRVIPSDGSEVRRALADLSIGEPPPSSRPPASARARGEKDLEPDLFDDPIDLKLAAQPKWKAPTLDQRLVPPSYEEPRSRRGLDPLPIESRRADKPRVDSSIPPVLDPRAARSSVSPAPLPPADDISSIRPTSAPKAPAAAEASPSGSSKTAQPSPPAAFAPASAGGAKRTPTIPGTHPSPVAAMPVETRDWDSRENGLFVARVAVPALAAYGILMGVRALSVPLGRALRGDSTLASGIVAVIVLVTALGLCAKSVAGTKERALFVSAGGAVLFGIMMIIVTSGSGEAIELGVPAAGAAIVPFLGPIAPFAGAVAAIKSARRMWFSTYEKREAVMWATLASVLVFLTLALSPIGAVLRR